MNFKDGKNTLTAVSKRGESMGICATFNEKYLCCNVHVLRSVQNCPFECTYCFLQNYLNDAATKTVSDIGALIDEVKEKIQREPDRLFRIGTWELGDSLALEVKTGQAARLIREFDELDNSVLELKTKSDSVDQICKLDHKGKTVISWSLNPERIIKSDEHHTASLENRINAMKKVEDAGFLLGLHFDPMIFHKGWEDGYKSLVNKVFNNITAERVAWVSIGSLRFNPEMKKKIENNYPDSEITSAEMVLGDDAKVRYVKPLRLEMYKLLYNELSKYLPKNGLIYLCMERWDVWDRILGYHLDSAGHLDYLFAKSLFERYRIGPGRPEKEIYFDIRIEPF